MNKNQTYIYDNQKDRRVFYKLSLETEKKFAVVIYPKRDRGKEWIEISANKNDWKFIGFWKKQFK